MSNTVLFRCDASPELGLGHVFRCCTLAAQWLRQGGRSLMLGPSADVCPAEFSHVFSHWQPCEFENEFSDAERTCDFAFMHHANALVMDDYRVNDDYQQVLMRHHMHWLQFDGTGQKSLWADWVLNAMPGTHADLYANRLKNPKTRLLLGLDYALLRPGFTEQAISDKNEQKSKRLFLFAGGGDDKQVLKLILNAVLSLNAGLKVCVVTSSNNPGLNDLRLWINSDSHSESIELHVDTKDMPSLMRSCGMAVVSAGTVTYEVNATGLPMVMFSMAQNQNAQALAWSALTGASYLGDYRQLTVSTISKAVTDMLDHAHTPVTQWVDGQGAQRVVDVLWESMP